MLLLQMCLCDVAPSILAEADRAMQKALGPQSSFNLDQKRNKDGQTCRDVVEAMKRTKRSGNKRFTTKEWSQIREEFGLEDLADAITCRNPEQQVDPTLLQVQCRLRTLTLTERTFLRSKLSECPVFSSAQVPEFYL